jgi:hypothetical protein
MFERTGDDAEHCNLLLFQERPIARTTALRLTTIARIEEQCW